MTFWQYLTRRRMLLLAERLASCGISAEDVALILAAVEGAEAASDPDDPAKRAGWR
jgi:hypothetical protein